MRIKQLNLDCYGCRGPLDDGEELTSVMENAAASVGATVIGKSVQAYPEYGLTAVVFLAESHILVSTYPEFKYYVVEIFMCNPGQDPASCGNYVLGYLKPDASKSTEFFHEIGASPQRSRSVLSRLAGSIEPLIRNIVGNKEQCSSCGSSDLSREFINAGPLPPICLGVFLRNAPSPSRWHYTCQDCNSDWYR